jgi:hemerythrin-like domain-containing protein
MVVQIGGKPDSGFENPIGMLTDCHRRIERFVSVLGHVAAEAEGRALKVEECNAVEAALRYFQDSGPRHNCDEEESLFPRLRAAAQAPAELAPLIDRLASEHGYAEALHKKSSEIFARWMAEGDLHAADRSRLKAALDKLQQIYTEHIRIEEDVVFLCASRLLDSEAVAAIGAEFRGRRD